MTCLPRRRNYAPVRCFCRGGQHGGDHLTRSVGPPLSLSALVLCRLDGTPDTAMSPHVFDSVSSQAVEVDSVGPSQFACPLPTSAGSSPPLTTNQFYIQGQQGRLLIRSFNQVRHSVNCCPPLPLLPVPTAYAALSNSVGTFSFCPCMSLCLRLLDKSVGQSTDNRKLECVLHQAMVSCPLFNHAKWGQSRRGKFTVSRFAVG